MRSEARVEAERIVTEGKKELEVLSRRRQDINAEITRVQDVLEALESFQQPIDGGKSNSQNVTQNGKNTVTAGAAAGTTRTGSKRSDDAPLD